MPTCKICNEPYPGEPIKNGDVYHIQCLYDALKEVREEIALRDAEDYNRQMTRQHESYNED